VADPVRPVEFVLEATVSVTLPAPVPLVRDSVIHDLPDEAVQAHPADVVTVTLWLPPVFDTNTLVGETVKVHAAAAACVTVTVWPAMVAAAVREAAVGFTEAANVTDPLPLPLVGDAVSHAALDAAVHPQPAGLDTETFADPPPLAMAAVVGDTE
jgi:hypothetical protein